MAVIVQQMVVGEVSGILFTRAPQDSKVMMVEAVWGLNQALVDGTLQPDRWQLDRASGKVVEKHEVKHEKAMRPGAYGVELIPLEEEEKWQSPLNETRCRELHQIGSRLEALLGDALDIEWTFSGGTLYILQARPVTKSLSATADDERPWYLSLHRSLDNLEELQRELEQEVLPGMERDAKQMASIKLGSLQNHQLQEEYSRRSQALQDWLQVYKEKCIPMAHGLRLFGEFYNDLVKPDDPYEFLRLLHSDDLLAVQRNRQLNEMAAVLRATPSLLKRVKEDRAIPAMSPLQEMLADFEERFSGMNWVLQGGLDLPGWLIKLAEQEPVSFGTEADSGTDIFLDNLAEEERRIACRILNIAKSSYLLRDNDNLYLGKVRAEVASAEVEIKKRFAAGSAAGLDHISPTGAGTSTLFSRYENHQEKELAPSVRQLARQLVGQPAGPGVCSGPARVLDDASALMEFSKGEVLVCDAIEPNMTFLAPMAAAIIERRGGMLIHGAIIAREYGIPCVTGIPDATTVIQTGDILSVDG